MNLSSEGEYLLNIDAYSGKTMFGCLRWGGGGRLAGIAHNIRLFRLFDTAAAC